MFHRTRPRTELGAVPVLAALLGGPAPAQNSAPEDSLAADITTAPQPTDEIVVRGRRLSEIEADLRVEIGKFLAEVAGPISVTLTSWSRSLPSTPPPSPIRQ